MQRKGEITVGCAGGRMEEDSKIPNRPGVIWLKDLVLHCSTEHKHLLTPARGGGGDCRQMKAEELSEGEMSG